MLFTVIAAPMEGLIAYYSFDGEDIGIDDSGNGHHAIHHNVVPVEGMSGFAGQFLQDSGMIVDSLNNFAWGDQFTISLWFRRTGLWGDYVPLANNSVDNQPSWTVQGGREQGGGVVWGGVASFGDQNVDDAGPANAEQDRWNHVALVYSRGNGFLIVNGHPHPFRRPEHGRLISRPGPVFIGTGWWQGNRLQYEGMMDEVRIYNRALSGPEINALSVDVAASSTIPESDRSPVRALPPTLAAMVQSAFTGGSTASSQPSKPVPPPVVSRPAETAPPPDARWWSNEPEEKLPDDIEDAELARKWIEMWKEGKRQAVVDDLNKRANER